MASSSGEWGGQLSRSNRRQSGGALPSPAPPGLQSNHAAHAGGGAKKKLLAGPLGELRAETLGHFRSNCVRVIQWEGNLAGGATRERRRKSNLKLFRLPLPNRIKSNAADPGREEAERGRPDLV